MSRETEIRCTSGDEARHRLKPLRCNRLRGSGDTVTDMGVVPPLPHVHNIPIVTIDTNTYTCETPPRERDTPPTPSPHHRIPSNPYHQTVYSGDKPNHRIVTGYRISNATPA